MDKYIELRDVKKIYKMGEIMNKNGYEFLLSKREFFDNTEKIGITEI